MKDHASMVTVLLVIFIDKSHQVISTGVQPVSLSFTPGPCNCSVSTATKPVKSKTNEDDGLEKYPDTERENISHWAVGNIDSNMPLGWGYVLVP